MKGCNRDILLLKRIKDDPIWHDPLYDQVVYEPSHGRWNFNFDSPPKAFMTYARPIQICTRKWDSITGEWETLFIDEYESYYRPVEFYDHYLSPLEIDSVKDKRKFVNKWLIYLKKEAKNMWSLDPLIHNAQISILELMINKDISYMSAIHLFIKNNSYRIFRNVPNHDKFIFKQYPICTRDFDETWNTVDYFHMFLPKERTYFVNPESFKCTCISFKKTKTCKHNLEFIVKRVLYSKYENTQLMVDLYPFILKYLY